MIWGIIMEGLLSTGPTTSSLFYNWPFAGGFRSTLPAKLVTFHHIFTQSQDFIFQPIVSGNKKINC